MRCMTKSLAMSTIDISVRIVCFYYNFHVFYLFFVSRAHSCNRQMFTSNETQKNSRKWKNPKKKLNKVLTVFHFFFLYYYVFYVFLWMVLLDGMAVWCTRWRRSTIGDWSDCKVYGCRPKMNKIDVHVFGLVRLYALACVMCLANEKWKRKRWWGKCQTIRIIITVIISKYDSRKKSFVFTCMNIGIARECRLRVGIFFIHHNSYAIHMYFFFFVSFFSCMFFFLRLVPQSTTHSTFGTNVLNERLLSMVSCV